MDQVPIHHRIDGWSFLTNAQSKLQNYMTNADKIYDTGI